MIPLFWFSPCRHDVFEVRTVFWFQNSKVFPDCYSKTMISFSRLKIIKQVINKDLKKKPQEQSFSFHDALQTYRLDWIKFDQNDDNFTYKALAVAFKKAFFQILSPFSRLFAGLENCWANVKTFPRLQDSVQNLCLLTIVLHVTREYKRIPGTYCYG